MYYSNLIKGLLAFVCLCVFSTASAQQLKKQPDQHPRGHALYKQSKLFDSRTGPTESKPSAVGDNAIDRQTYEFNRLKNPYTGKMPAGIADLELRFSEKIAEGQDMQHSADRMGGRYSKYGYWKNRGPFNVGGRTRALAIDITNENVILAGGVSGGLWRSVDAGATWRKVTANRQAPGITCIVQDPRPGKHHIWYYGTGERIGNSASEGGAFYSGTGVYKSVNGGRSFKLLSATDDDAIGSFGPFDITNSIAIDPTNGDLYVATFNGLHRSTDGGKNFEEILTGGFDATVEVAITSQGQIYATIDFSGVPNAGIFTSDDGDNWTNITPAFYPIFFGRTVMGIDPTNENRVYFLNHDELGPQGLFRYIATDAIGSRWTDLSANLPVAIGGPVGNLNFQTGYNMLVKVHPGDSSTVFVGGTNLYRSNTAFTTPTGQESWIAGYSPLNNVSVYPDQHPDHHALVFYPSNPDKVLSGTDGGVFLADDITTSNSAAEPVDWTSLNNGYVTTQPYAVAFDPEPNSDDLLAGFQDNGTWFTSSTDLSEPWEEDFGGDGSYNAIADAGATRYVSSQFGNIYRLNFDSEGEFESFTRVKPAGANNLDFVAPFVLDPHNDNIMYLPDGNRIWRNNDLDGIPLFSNATTTVNWVNLPNSDTPAGTTITSLDLSTYPEANRLYYGTNSGGVYRMDNANLDNQPATDLTTGKGLPPGYVNDISVDPSNGDRVVISFSNYGIQSLFLTEDGGETWVNVSGNLEENEDGTGNGPSVRSTAFFGGSDSFFGPRIQKVFAATSTGLYYTRRLDGSKTRWYREPFIIGNAVTDEVKTRKDGFIAVGAHGNGLFSARFPIFFNPLPESKLSVAYLLEDLVVDENSSDVVVNIEDLFVHSHGQSIDVELINTNPGLVTVTDNGTSLTLSFAADTLGSATIGLIATSGNEQVAEGFTVFISKPTLYEQLGAGVTSLPSQNFIDFGGIAQTADDFVVPVGDSWEISNVLAFGGANNSPTFTSVSVVIYEDNLGSPGLEIYNSGEIVPDSDPLNANLNLTLPDVVQLNSGTYWISVYTNLAFNPAATQWFWTSQNGGIGAEPQFRDNLNLFGTGAIDWTGVSTAFGQPPLDQVFQVFGSIIPAAASAASRKTEAVPLAELSMELSTVVWPNPSKDQFTFKVAFGENLESIDERVNMRIYNTSGRLVHRLDNIDVASDFVWDAYHQPVGIYMVKITGSSTHQSFKIIKR
ncbi:MAG: T9SS type A sorting domain-containing protein [Reichenbachiella sp.]|uniref:T9SS type A sorting domain-containing protein n=1 Tax=Reichenbachiella sp. TaxID=2184521 RepID=UPI003267976B